MSLLGAISTCSQSGAICLSSFPPAQALCLVVQSAPPVAERTRRRRKKKARAIFTSFLVCLLVGLNPWPVDGNTPPQTMCHIITGGGGGQSGPGRFYPHNSRSFFPRRHLSHLASHQLASSRHGQTETKTSATQVSLSLSVSLTSLSTNYQDTSTS